MGILMDFSFGIAQFISYLVYAGYRRSVDGPTAEGNVTNNLGQQQSQPPQQQQTSSTTNAQATTAPQPAPRRFGSLSSGPVDGEREVRIA